MADGGKALWSVIWLLVLVFIGFFVGGFCAGWYIIFSVFSVCIEGCGPVTEILLKGIQVPRMCTEYMLKGTPFKEAFK